MLVSEEIRLKDGLVQTTQTFLGFSQDSLPVPSNFDVLAVDPKPELTQAFSRPANLPRETDPGYINRFLMAVFGEAGDFALDSFMHASYPSVWDYARNEKLQGKVSRLVASCQTSDDRAGLVSAVGAWIPDTAQRHVAVLSRENKKQVKAIGPEEAGKLTDQDREILADAVVLVNERIKATYAPGRSVQVPCRANWNWRVLRDLRDTFNTRWNTKVEGEILVLWVR